MLRSIQRSSALSRLRSLPKVLDTQPCTSSSAHYRYTGIPTDTSTWSLNPIPCTLKYEASYPEFMCQQARWKRKDGSRYAEKTTKTTKKQRKKYHRQLRDIQAEKEKHGKPGSRAGVRREWERQQEQALRNRRLPVDNSIFDQYDRADALLDDLMGNTPQAVPAPEPVYLGHQQERLFQQVTRKMELSSKNLTDLTTNNHESTILSVESMPTDQDIALAIRAYRDKYGTRQKPIGVLKGLEHILQEMKVSMSMLGEYSFNALLSCCRTPAEARRIMKLMAQQPTNTLADHKSLISEYTWSILVDIHAKIGDFEGAARVQQEMLHAGFAPTMASFTSLLSACYKVCSDTGRVSHKIRAKAADVAWEKWQEMRIVGLEPDVMAYGAILRILAVKGQPERALNILDEMQRLGVNPTTLCFTSALRSVARSHSIAIRYENGSSRKNRRREFLTQHHGRLAHKMVVLAEQAGVDQDEGFVAALIQCAAAAGDLATAKALYLAHQIRHMDQYATIGDENHLKKLRGEVGGSSIVSEEDDSLFLPEELETFAEREYGRDNRLLSSLMYACSRSASMDGLGDMWQGRENAGLFCLNSLRLINARALPQYTDNSIPGQGRTDALTWEGEHHDVAGRDKKRKPPKFQGVTVDDDAGSTLDDLDEEFLRMYVDDDGNLKEDFRPTTFDDVWEMKYGKDSFTNDSVGNELRMNATFSIENEKVFDAGILSADTEKEKITEVAQVVPSLYFDQETMRWKERNPESIADDPIVQATRLNSSSGTTGSMSREKTVATRVVGTVVQEPISPKQDPIKKDSREELYFDSNERCWKTRLVSSQPESDASRNGAILQTTAPSEELPQSEVDLESEFQLFYQGLKEEVAASGEDIGDVTEEEARELFESMRDEFADLFGETSSDEQDELVFDGSDFIDGEDAKEEEDYMEDEGAKESSSFASSSASNSVFAHESSTSVVSVSGEARPSSWNLAPSDVDSDSSGMMQAEALVDDHFTGSDMNLEELRQLLPNFPESRLKKIMQTFKHSLEKPSILDLARVVREKMPDYVTNTWLKSMSRYTAQLIAEEAYKQGVLDQRIMNNCLEIETSCGSLDRALTLHQTGFEAHGLTPNAFSDRLVFQMFISNNRFQRAMDFKLRVEEGGRVLDLHSYSSLVDYLARHKQLGSSLYALRECIRVHGSPPSESSVSRLRPLAREKGLESELEALVGPDPIRWLKEGESKLKREYSKKGRRDVLLPRNRLINV